MRKTVFILVLTSSLLTENVSINLNATDDSFQDCTSYKDDFWYIYDNHFLLVDHLTIQVLQTHKYKLEVNHYTNKLLSILSLYDYNVALEIEETFLNETSFDEKLSTYNYSHTPIYLNFDHNLEPIDHNELVQIKRLSSDSLKGYCVVVWDVATLHRFLDEDFRIVIPEERATYALQFVFYSSELCTTIRNDVSGILRRFWLDYNVINVIAQTPCCCDGAQVYIYRPFVKMDESWGVTQSYSFEEITDNFRTITNLLNDFNQFPLNVNIFERVPTAVRRLPKLLKGNPIYRNLSSSEGFAGDDGLILGTLAEYLNFDVNLVGSTAENYFGIPLGNGSFTPGALKDIVDRKIVYSGNGRYLVNYDKYGIEFTVPHNADQNCVVVAKAKKIPVWTSLFRCLETTSWILIIVTCATCTVFWYHVGPTRALRKASWTMFSYLFGVPERKEPQVPQFVFLTACMLFNIVLLGIIQGSMFRAFSIVTYYHDINTLEELDKSGLPLSSTIWYYLKDDTPVLHSLRKKSIPLHRFSYQTVAMYRNFSISDSRATANFKIKSQYVDDDGSPLLHVVDECFSTFLLSHIMPKGSAFKTVFDDVITKVIEAGLRKKWRKDIVDSLIVEKMTSLQIKSDTARPFSLYDLQIAFYVIAVGYFSSLLLFGYEILSDR